MRFGLISALPLATALFAVPVFATSYTATFYGTETSPNNSSFTATLAGTIDFSSNVSPVYNPIHASDLSAFSLVTTFDPGHGPGAAEWDFGLGDLSSFTFETATSGIPPLLTLMTDSINSVKNYIYPGQIAIAGVGANQVSLMIDGGSSPFATATVGTISATPEPSSCLLIGISSLLLAGYWRLRRWGHRIK
jgi:hypothetical protein